VKALAFLTIAHLAVCAVAAYCFHERHTIQRVDQIPTVPTEPNGGGWFAGPQTVTEYGLPAPIVIYFSAGLSGLCIAFVINVVRNAS
jgi:hypothetical protein